MRTIVPESRTERTAVPDVIGDPGLPAAALSVRGVSKRLGGVPVLRGIDLDVQPGTVAVVAGPSGSGKSTLLRCICHLETVDAGEIRLGGQLVGYDLGGGVLREQPDREVAAIRRRIGMVFQHFNLFSHMTALQNVAYGPRRILGLSEEAARDRAASLLARVGLEDRTGAYPARLSGGQQQRVAIARALAMEPELMLFDEPTSSLDPELTGEVLEVMKDVVAQGMTVVVVTHEIGFAVEVGDTMAILDDGVVIERGAPANVVRSPQQPRTRQFLTRIHRG
jgi:polar amino acid transport system ATP-binding protein